MDLASEDSAPPKRSPHPLERSRSYTQHRKVLTLKSERKIRVDKQDLQPLLNLKLLQPLNASPPISGQSPENEPEHLEITTHEFLALPDINSVRPFPLSHMVGGFSARGTTPDDVTRSTDGPRQSPCVKLSKKKGWPDCKDKPVLIKYERGELSPSSQTEELSHFSARLPSTRQLGSPTSVAFLPGKDIAETHSFLRAIVKNQPVRPPASAGFSPPRRRYDQTMAGLNHPCKCPIVLIVDDTEINKIVLSGMLTRLGLLHIEASNGAEAIDLLKDHNEEGHCHCAGIKLVLMDCGMPIMDGFEATTEIKRMIQAKTIAPTTIVAVTAYESSTIEQECKDAGMTEVINKPVSIERLIQCLHDYLDP